MNKFLGRRGIYSWSERINYLPAIAFHSDFIRATKKLFSVQSLAKKVKRRWQAGDGLRSIASALVSRIFIFRFRKGGAGAGIVSVRILAKSDKESIWDELILPRKKLESFARIHHERAPPFEILKYLKI